MTIRSFKHGGLKRLYEPKDERRIHPSFRKRVKAILALADQAEAPADLAAPGYRLHLLKGRPNCWSMRVSRNWRIVIRVEDSEAWDVDLADYPQGGTSAMAMRNPPHPGVNIREGWMVDGMSVSEAAAWVGVPPNTLGRVLDGCEGISPELASRLKAAGWSRRDLWLRLQAAYDKAQARIRSERRELPRHDQLRPAHASQG